MNKKLISALLAVIAGGSFLTGCGTRSSNVQDIPIISIEVTETTAPETTTEAETETVTEYDTEILTANETDISEETETSAEKEILTEPSSDEGYPVVDDSYVAYHFRTKKQLNQHFEKHGAEFDGDFDYETALDYEKGASDVINNDEALTKYEAEDGDEVYYIEATNEFVILSTDGYIRTYFRPSSGKKYFDRQ